MHAPLDPRLRTQWRALASLADGADEWRALAARALEPNVFYEPAFALAAAPVFGPDAGALLVRAPAGELLGLFPLRIEYRYGPLLPLLAGFVHPYAPLGTPLIDRDHADAVIDAFFDHLQRDAALPRLLRMPLLPEAGAFAAALERVLARRGLMSAHFGRHGRAQLVPSGNRAGYIEHAVNAKIRKELIRKRRRLAEIGPLAHQTVAVPAAIKSTIGRFLAIEASGWKGRSRTAAASDPNIRAFFEKALVDLSAEGKARCDLLSVGNCPIAAAIVLRSGIAAWDWKIAYDERFSRFSPGVQITLDVTRSLLADDSIERIDSCATPDHPMIDHLWRERLILSDRLISLKPGATPVFLFACGLESLRRVLFSAAKPVRSLVSRIR